MCMTREFEFLLVMSLIANRPAQLDMLEQAFNEPRHDT